MTSLWTYRPYLNVSLWSLLMQRLRCTLWTRFAAKCFITNLFSYFRKEDTLNFFILNALLKLSEYIFFLYSKFFPTFITGVKTCNKSLFFSVVIYFNSYFPFSRQIAMWTLLLPFPMQPTPTAVQRVPSSCAPPRSLSLTARATSRCRRAPLTTFSSSLGTWCCPATATVAAATPVAPAVVLLPPPCLPDLRSRCPGAMDSPPMRISTARRW